MKKLLTAVLISCLAVSLAACGGTKTESPTTTDGAKTEAPAEEKIVIKMGSTSADGLPSDQSILWAIEQVKEKSGGRIQIEMLNNSQLGNDESLMQQVMDGTLKCVSVGTSVVGKYTNVMDGLQLPFLINTYEKEYAMITSPEMDKIKEKMATDLNVYAVALYENGIRHFANNIRPINTPEDLKGLKLRVVPGSVVADAIGLMGGNPTTIPYAEIYTSLQNNIVDGEEVNYSTIYFQKHYEALKYVSEIGMYPFPGITFFNKEYLDSLAVEDKELIVSCFEAAQEKCFTDFIVSIEEEAKKACEEQDVVINVIENIEPFREKTAGLYDEYAQKDPLIAEFIEAAKALK